MNFIKQKIKDIIRELFDDPPDESTQQEVTPIDKKISIVQAGDLLESLGAPPDDLRIIALLSDLDQEKMADIMSGFLTLKASALENND